jgi:threonine/homoserine/homoserine lactone efflux protein
MNKTVKYFLIYVAVAGGAYLLYKQYQVMQNKLDGDAALKKWNAQHN